MVRISSPGTYSRTSSNSMPIPLKTLAYCPAKGALRSRFTLNWIFRTFFRISEDSIGFLGNLHFIKEAFNDLFHGDPFRLRLVGDDNPVAQDRRADPFDVPGDHVTPAF